MNVAKHLIDRNVVWDDPADPGEVAEGLEEVSGEEVPDSRAQECIKEEAFTADTTTVTDTSICLCM